MGPGVSGGEPSEVPGTVFVTRHGDIETVWVVMGIDRTAGTAAYSRLTVGHHAGTVWVRCDDRLDGRCVVSVEYDMTALDPGRPHVLDPYDEDHFGQMMNDWKTSVTGILPSDNR